ncbi:MAG TPA: DNA translocase FtsK 4TM domain-containing protein, partial [Anaerolineae bacterium]|nr:DNA translocase FtsK 4TM domain-containing protein [Anaerolineae bacterium]
MTHNNESTTPTTKKTWDELLIPWLMQRQVEILGLILFIIASVTLLGLLRLTASPWLVSWTGWWHTLMGWGSFIANIFLALTGIHLILHQVKLPYRVTPLQIVGGELLFLLLLALSHHWQGATQQTAYQGAGGGLIGWAIGEPLLELLGPLMTSYVYLFTLTLGLALLTKVSWADFLKSLRWLAQQLKKWGEQLNGTATPTTTNSNHSTSSWWPFTRPTPKPRSPRSTQTGRTVIQADWRKIEEPDKPAIVGTAIPVPPPPTATTTTPAPNIPRPETPVFRKPPKPAELVIIDLATKAP